MARYMPQKEGTVILNQSSLEVKQRPDPRNQQLSLNPELFVMQKGQPSPAKVQMHGRIKQLIGEKNLSRSEAVKIARAEYQKTSNNNSLNSNDLYGKYQAQQPGRELTRRFNQKQEMPFM